MKYKKTFTFLMILIFGFSIPQEFVTVSANNSPFKIEVSTCKIF
ncbi:hypothetical protein J2T56_003250 [Natronobacillus azotifigens]